MYIFIRPKKDEDENVLDFWKVKDNITSPSNPTSFRAALF